MVMDAPTLPKIPYLSVVAETVRLAQAAEAERHEQRPADWPACRADELDDLFRPTPAQDALVSFLRDLQDEDVAGLYGLLRLGDHPHPTPEETMERFRDYHDLAMQPQHRRHGVADLVSKGLLAHGLRRGLERLGLRLEAGQTGGSNHPPTKTS